MKNTFRLVFASLLAVLTTLATIRPATSQANVVAVTPTLQAAVDAARDR